VTCQRARVALEQAGASFERVDIFRTPLTVEDLVKLKKDRPVADLFSWKSPQARARGITPGSRADEELIRLMAEEPRLIRRPLIRIGDQLVIGADARRILELARSV
jgi:arsenate reductase (glutaredoxin)